MSAAKKGQREPRTPAEWVTFAISLLILGGVVALIVMQIPGSDRPAAPVARLAGEAREKGQKWFVPVEVSNEGDLTAENLQVAAELVVGAETFEADQTLDFLAGGESQRLEFVFDEDPSKGELTVEVTGYREP